MKITPQQNVNLTWRETRAWLKTLQLKEKSSERRRRHIVEMDDAIRAINNKKEGDKVKKILIGAICGVLATPLIWFAAVVFLQLDVLFE
jgi:hypothetical protein